MLITWNNKINLHMNQKLELHKCVESEWYSVMIQNSTHHNSIPNDFNSDSTIAKNDSNSNTPWSQNRSLIQTPEYEWIAPGLNHFLS